MKRQGFSLVELLVVIAIIAILAAIIFPVFVVAKGAARRVVCSSNMKQIWGAIGLYTKDNGDRLPYTAAWGKVWVMRGTSYPPLVVPLYDPPNYLPDLIDRYLGNNDKVWWCPSIDRKELFPRSTIPVYENGTTYFWNHATFDKDKNYYLVAGSRYDAAVAPSKAYILGDMNQWGNSNPSGCGDLTPHGENRLNAMFLDGHVKVIDLKPDGDLWRQQESKGFRR